MKKTSEDLARGFILRWNVPVAALGDLRALFDQHARQRAVEPFGGAVRRSERGGEIYVDVLTSPEAETHGSFGVAFQVRKEAGLSGGRAFWRAATVSSGGGQSMGMDAATASAYLAAGVHALGIAGALDREHPEGTEFVP